MTSAENINRICAEKGTNLTAIVKAGWKKNAETSKGRLPGRK